MKSWQNKEAWRDGSEYVTHKAADFQNTAGERVFTLQLIAPNGYAYAILDFCDNRVTRFDCAQSIQNEAREWMSQMVHIAKIY